MSHQNRKETKDHLCIEPLSEQSSFEASLLFYQAFSTKFKMLDTMNDELRQDLFFQVWQQNLFNPHEHQYVVKTDGRVVATFGLGFSDVLNYKSLNTNKHNKKWAIVKKFGLINLLKINLLCSLFDHKPKQGELYISYIGVAGDYQGQGIGQFVINWILEQAAEIYHAKMVSLYVAKNNLNAKHLYDKFLFIENKIEHSFMTKLSINILSWYYMTYQIKSK